LNFLYPAAAALQFARGMLPRIDSVPRSVLDRIAEQVGALCADRRAPVPALCQ